MSDFKAKMHQIVCRLGLRPDPEYIVYISYTYMFCVIGLWSPYYKIVPQPMPTAENNYATNSPLVIM